jgi:hypothetical protein
MIGCDGGTSRSEAVGQLRWKNACSIRGLAGVRFAKVTAPYQRSSREICKTNAVQVRVPQVWLGVFLALNEVTWRPTELWYGRHTGGARIL